MWVMLSASSVPNFSRTEAEVLRLPRNASHGHNSTASARRNLGTDEADALQAFTALALGGGITRDRILARLRRSHCNRWIYPIYSILAVTMQYPASVCWIFLSKSFVVRRLQISCRYAPSSLLVLPKNLLRNHFARYCMVTA